jgi:hypothetical protein
LTVTLLILFCAPAAIAQQPSPTPVKVETQPVTSTATEPKKPAPAEKLKRWLDIEALTLSTRYRLIRSNAGVNTTNQQQWQFAGRGRFKFDPKGKYSIYLGFFTGDTLTSGWDTTGLGTGDLHTNIYPKLLYFNAKPVKWFELQVGSIGAYNGENTEITGLDNDIYMTGERVQIRSPKNLFFDEISVTNAYLGDVNTPNAFRRFKRLDEANYHQFMVRKQLNKRVGFSADYTFDSGRDTFREAVNVKTPELKVVDRIWFENYQHVDPDHAYGFGLSGEKKLNSRLTLIGGFARLERALLNGDRFGVGKRLYLTSNYKISRELSFSTALIQGIGSLPSGSTPRTRLDLILNFNLLEMFRHIKVY